MAEELRDIDAETQTISDSIMSPFCPGRTLSACPSGQATELRSEISGWLKQGYTEDAVYNQLRIRYGDTVSGVPAASGLGLLGWIAPGLFVLFALLVVMKKLKTMRGGEAQAAPAPDPIMQGKIEAEINQRLGMRR